MDQTVISTAGANEAVRFSETFGTGSVLSDRLHAMTEAALVHCCGQSKIESNQRHGMPRGGLDGLRVLRPSESNASRWRLRIA